MAKRSVVTRVVAPTVATAVLSAAVAIAVNLATEWLTNVWAWFVVGVMTLLSSAASLWLYRQSSGSDGSASPPDQNPQMDRSVGDNVSGSIVITGDHNEVGH